MAMGIRNLWQGGCLTSSRSLNPMTITYPAKTSKTSAVAVE